MRSLLVFLTLYFMASLPALAELRLERIGPPLNHPWGLDSLSDKAVLVTTRNGQLFRIDLDTYVHSEITNVPQVAHYGQGGLLDVLVLNDEVFLCYAKPTKHGAATAIDKARLIDNRLTGRMTIFTANSTHASAHHFGCRLALQDGYLFASLGDRGNRKDAQRADLHDGSIIRIARDGTAPSDNPRKAGWADEIFTIGHRNPQGMTLHQETNTLWAHEHGPQGGDEINIISAGQNYGWPLISHGKEYGTDTPVSARTSHPDMRDPKWVWIPSIAPSGMAFYPKDAPLFPALQNSLLVGSLKFKRLYQVIFDKDLNPTSERIIIDGTIGRIRDIAIASDGSVLLLRDANDKQTPAGGLYRLSQ